MSLFHDQEPAWLELYTGYATPSGGLLVGRAHRGTPFPAPLPGESTLARLRETLQALESCVLSNVEVAVTVGEEAFTVRTDSHGYINLTLPPLPLSAAPVSLTLTDPRYAAVAARGALPVFDAGPGLGVISDVDDTLLDTGVSHKLTMIERALTRSSWELQAFDGAAAAVSALAAGRPCAYISGSPWGFHQRIADYFQRAGFPAAPLVLKRFSREPLTDQLAYKWPHVTALVDALPERRFILLGDSSEQDPELYARLARERPGSVAAVFIHLVTDESPASPRFAGATVFRAWSEITERLAPWRA